MSEQMDDEKVIFEMLDYSLLTLEMFFLAIAVIVSLITSIGYGGVFIAIEKYSYIGFISIIYLYTRGLKFLYSFFYLKKYKLIFYKNKIEQTYTNKTFPLNTINGKYNILMYSNSEYDSNKSSKNKCVLSYFVLFLFLPLSIFILTLLTFSRVLPILIYKKRFSVSDLYSLVVTFPEYRAINIHYGLLSQSDIDFLEKYFKNYFDMHKLKKAYLYVPRGKGEENEQ